MNFPVKSKARLKSVYCLYLGIHNREWLNVTNHHNARNTEPHNREWSNARNTLNPTFWGLSELGTTTFCSCWCGRQRTDGSLTLGFFCNIHIVFVPEIAVSRPHFFSPLLCVFLRRNYIKFVSFFALKSHLNSLQHSPCLKPNKTNSNNKTHQKTDRKAWLLRVFNCQMVPLLWLSGTSTRCFYWQLHLYHCDKEGWQRLMNCVLLSRAWS